MLPGISTAAQVLAATGAGGSGGTARQVVVMTALGPMDLNSGSTARQTPLPGTDVTQGR